MIVAIQVELLIKLCVRNLESNLDVEISKTNNKVWSLIRENGSTRKK
jgi:hypothetical protein